MANLAIVGSHSTDGVSAIHSELLRSTTVKDFAEFFPARLNNNGVTPRRRLLLANPPLARTISEAIGDGWIAGRGASRGPTEDEATTRAPLLLLDRTEVRDQKDHLVADRGLLRRGSRHD